MYKIIYLFILLLVVNSVFSILDTTIHQILNPDELKKGLYESTERNCYYDVQILVQDTLNENILGEMKCITSGIINTGQPLIIAKNQNSAIYNFFTSISDSQKVVSFNVSRVGMEDYTFSITLTCSSVDSTALSFTLLSYYKPQFQLFQALYKIDGIPYSPSLYIINYGEGDGNYYGAFYKIVDNYYLLNLNRPVKRFDNNYWNITLYFFIKDPTEFMQTYELSIKNPFKDIINDNSNINSFSFNPNEPSNNIGFFSSPIYSFNFKNSKDIQYQFFNLIDITSSITIYDSPIPVGGKMGNITYLGNTFYSLNMKDSETCSFNFSVNSGSTKVLIKNFQVSYNRTKYGKLIVKDLNSDCTYDYCYNHYTVTNVVQVTRSFQQILVNDNNLKIYAFISLEFPFSYTKGNINNYTHSTSFSRNPKSFYSFSPFIENKSNSQIKAGSDIFLDNKIPLLNNFQINLINGRTFLLKLNISDNSNYDTGLMGIYIGQFYDTLDYKVFRNESLVSDGTYEIVFDFMETSFNNYQIVLIDSSDKRLVVHNNKYINMDLKLNLQDDFLLDYDITTIISNITFARNNINTTNLMYNNQIFLEFKSGIANNLMVHNIPIVFEFSKSRNIKDIYYLKYDESIAKWTTFFRIPANLMDGTVNYIIYPSFINPIKVSNSILPDQFQLNVFSNNFDYMGPVIENIEKLSINQMGDEMIFGFNVTISDEINGFKNGYITIRGDLDNSVYNFTLSSKDNLLETPFKSKFQLLVSIPNTCTSMNYNITEIYLEDTQGQYTTFSNYNYQTNQFPQLNSLINYLGKPNDLSIPIKCNTNYNASSYPEIINFSINEQKNTPTIDLTKDSNLTVNFEVYDQFGIKTNQLPILYLSGYNLQIIQSKCSLLDGYSLTSFKYRCNIIVPYSFGILYNKNYTNSISLSIYGLISNNGNFNGYSRYDLEKLNYPSYFNSTVDDNFKFNQLKLNSGYYDGSNKNLTLIGNNLLNVNRIVVSSDSGFSNIITQITIGNTDRKTDSFITISKDLQTENDNLYIKVLTKDNQQSNYITISSTIIDDIGPVPIKYPEKNETCSISINCGGSNRGYCKSNQCICLNNYIGKNCESEIIIVPQPPIQPDKPDTSIDIPNDIDIKSIISIVSIREINIAGEQQFKYDFEKWNLTKLSESKYKYVTDIIIDSDRSTGITVTLEWFKEKTIIEFANQNLVINPSTMKYTIELSKYPFISKLNTLQLVLKSQIQSSKTNDICSNKEFGNFSTEEDYLKLSINSKSFYGKFIKRALVDNDPVTISNQILDSTFNSSTQSNKIESFIGINVPYYDNSIILDPDFSVLIESKSANSICSNKKGLTNGQIAGIVIGSFALFTIIILAIAKIIYSSSRFLGVKIFIYKLFKK